MPHLDLAYVGPGLAVPTWTPDDNDFATIFFSPKPGASTVSASNPAYSGYFDDGSHHNDNGTSPSVCTGDAFFHGSLKMRLEGMATFQVQVRPYRILADGSGSRVWTGPSYHEKIMDTDHDPAVTHWTVAVDERVPVGQRLRLEIAQMHTTNDFPDGLLKWCNLVARIDEL